MKGVLQIVPISVCGELWTTVCCVLICLGFDPSTLELSPIVGWTSGRFQVSQDHLGLHT